MSTTRLMILGLVRWLQPVHGYYVRRELESWNVEEWAAIAPGSIYHALRKLSQEGLLEEVGTEQVSARPARTSYRVTPAGEQEFQELLRRYWWDYKAPVDPFQVAFSFIWCMPPEEAAAALRHRAARLRAVSGGQAAMVESEFMRANKPVHVAWMFELSVARAELEADWCERMADRIEAGELRGDWEPVGFDERVEAGRIVREAASRSNEK
ncbi:PadR family transcriptional regulator [Luedemannella helvata]|uniref:PadR family transcriptional regulator n=1 Tax=Luedemannella helvata TaxID=349315 RepID=A0ABN2JPE5_9ACTN